MKTYKWLLFVLPVLLLGGVIWYEHSQVHIDTFDLRGRAELHSMDSALELFRYDCNDYPSSDANDPTGLPYCGAMKLAEALMGQDLLGFAPKSVLRRDGLDASGQVKLYSHEGESLVARVGPFIPPENANAWRLADIYGQGRTGAFAKDVWVLCDPFEKKRPSGKRTGMPILYYRAHPDRTAHDVNDPDNPQNIYDYKENQALLALGVPGDPDSAHPFADPKRFYELTRNHKIDTASVPYRPDTYLLISPGKDGLYGTADDVVNCEWKYCP